MIVAVTGASGFIGRHVLDELLACGQSVVATYRPGREPERKSPGLRWVELDVADPPLNAYDCLGRPQALIHLAWDGLPNYNSLHHIEDELPKHYRFLSRVVRQGLPALIASGTCFEYGMQYGPLSANAPTCPVSSYGFAKDTLFHQLKFLQAVHPFALTWARLFYIYGDDQSATSLFSLLHRAVAEGHAEFPMSGGEQLRDYLPVIEVAKKLVSNALTCRDRGAVNVCSGVPISVRRLVESWISAHDWNIALSLGQLPYPDYEPMAFWGVPGVDSP
jgi:dTDP-6-deoxy-L-talose 4-dehydrogenase (NAD+)